MDQRPQRLTRGRRFRRVLEEERGADDDFWGQDFFREDAEDDVYLTESDQESVADSDFSGTTTESGAESDREAEPLEPPRKKRLLPPGSSSRPPRPKRPIAKPVTGDEKESGTATPVTLRRSTLLRRNAAEKERRRAEELRRPKRLTKPSDRVAAIDLQTFLKDVAETEFANLASLNELEAFEEESKKRALQTRAKNKGPSVTLRSRRVGETEKTVLELGRIKKVPEWMKRQTASQAQIPQNCVVTGTAAKYRDPLTKLPYATVEAFREIRRQAALWPANLSTTDSASRQVPEGGLL